MINPKRRMAAVVLVVIALASITFLSYRNDIIPRSLAERLFPSSTSSAPSVTVVKEQPILRALLTLKAPQPAPNSVLTSERFVKNAEKSPVKSRGENKPR